MKRALLLCCLLVLTALQECHAAKATVYVKNMTTFRTAHVFVASTIDPLPAGDGTEIVPKGPAAKFRLNVGSGGAKFIIVGKFSDGTPNSGDAGTVFDLEKGAIKLICLYGAPGGLYHYFVVTDMEDMKELLGDELYDQWRNRGKKEAAKQSNQDRVGHKPKSGE